MKKSFEQRFAEALRRRLYPNTRLRLKTLSRDTGYSEDTITRWTQAKHRVFAGAVEDVAGYFASRFGDDGLLHEVFASTAGWAGPSPAADARAAWALGHPSITTGSHLRTPHAPIGEKSGTA
ncbi:MAG TPA: hypothetical protein VGB82_07295 [Alphaproteobacteria bacterium]